MCVQYANISQAKVTGCGAATRVPQLVRFQSLRACGCKRLDYPGFGELLSRCAASLADLDLNNTAVELAGPATLPPCSLPAVRPISLGRMRLSEQSLERLLMACGRRRSILEIMGTNIRRDAHTELEKLWLREYTMGFHTKCLFVASLFRFDLECRP